MVLSSSATDPSDIVSGRLLVSWGSASDPEVPLNRSLKQKAMDIWYGFASASHTLLIALESPAWSGSRGLSGAAACSSEGIEWTKYS